VGPSVGWLAGPPIGRSAACSLVVDCLVSPCVAASWAVCPCHFASLHLVSVGFSLWLELALMG
jgi:hypothetical protein